MPVGKLLISGDMVVSLCTAFTKGAEPRYCKVVENPLPADADFVGAKVFDDGTGERVVILVESEQLTEGQEIPAPVFETVWQ